MEIFKSIVNLWLGAGKLPSEHITIKPGDNYFRKFVVHPLKRRLAKYYLVLLKLFGTKVVAVTGSAGKTTTKEMIQSVLNVEGKTVASFENIDPIYNIPSTILKTPLFTKYLVLEMAVEYPREMDFYYWLASVDIGVIINIYPTHTEFFGDAGGVFREKSKLVKYLSGNGIAILNKEDKFLRKLEGNLKAKTVWFGSGTKVMSSQERITSDFKTEFILTFDQDPGKRINIIIPILGLHFITSALAASAVARSLNVSLEKIKVGLENFSPPRHRLKVIKHKSGAYILDDSYNSNPIAAKSAISTLLLLAKGEDKVVVFGDMLELGYWEKKYHIELGKYLGKSGLKFLICVDKASRITGEIAATFMGRKQVVCVSSWKEAVKKLEPLLKKNTWVLVKGSRSIGLDNLVKTITY